MKRLGKLSAVVAAVGLCATAFGAPDAVGTADRSSLIEQGQTLQEQSRDDLRSVLHLQQLAHKQKDVIKLNCVNELLVQIKPHMNMLDAAQSELSTSANPTVTLGTVQTESQAVRQLAEQARTCVGEPETGNEESSNSFTSPDIPDDPFTAPEPWHDTTVEPPGYASPFS